MRLASISTVTIAAAVATVFAVAACGAKPETLVSCDVAAEGICSERYVEDVDKEKKACSGTFAERGCGRDDEVGSCKSKADGDDLTTIFRKPMSAATATAACEGLAGSFASAANAAGDVPVLPAGRNEPVVSTLPDAPTPQLALTGRCEIRSEDEETEEFTVLNSCVTWYFGADADVLEDREEACEDLADTGFFGDDVETKWTASAKCATTNAVSACAIQEDEEDELTLRWAFLDKEAADEDCGDDDGTLVKP